MFKDSRVMPAIPVTDTKRAQEFYEGKLGLKVIHEDLADGSTEYECGNGTRLFTYPTENAGKSPATIASWQVASVEDTVKELRGKGVAFEDYDMPGLKTENGIASVSSYSVTAKVAWFKDPEGNILNVFERPFV